MIDFTTTTGFYNQVGFVFLAISVVVFVVYYARRRHN